MVPRSLEARTTPNPFDEIILTNDESIEALRKAREDKFFQLQREKYFEEIKKQKIRPRFSADQALNGLASLPGFVKDDDNEKVIKILCCYFAGDRRLESQFGFSLSKGICLTGPVGVGKTLLMQAFMANPHQSFVMPSCTSIENKWVNEGKKEAYTINDIGIVEHYSGDLAAPIDEPYLHEKLGICFEDLGTRDNTLQKRFGEEKNVMMEIILNRYTNQIPFTRTHFTTNLDVEGIERKYGTRVRDRMREMCNWIVLDGKSRRA